MSETVLPYPGPGQPNSGHSGSDTSRERAERDDSDGTTNRRQRLTMLELGVARYHGITWKELADKHGLHHGQASGVLSNLHHAGRIARLKMRRDRCHVYVGLEYVLNRDTEPYARNKMDTKELEAIITHMVHCGEPLEYCASDLHDKAAEIARKADQ